MAHTFLSAPDIEFRMGNLLADLVQGKDRNGMPDLFLLGCKCHRMIDSFTNFPPVTARSRQRIRLRFVALPEFRSMYSSIIYLAIPFRTVAEISLSEFVSVFYRNASQRQMELPAKVEGALLRIIKNDILVSYRFLSEVEATLYRVSQRLYARVGKRSSRMRPERSGKPVPLENAISELERNYEASEVDFLDFFPSLQKRVKDGITEHYEQDGMDRCGMSSTW